MQEFINMVTQQLGIGEDTARSATGGILNLLQKKAGDTDVDQLLSKLPGAETFGGSTDEPAATGGGMLGGLASTVGSALGGETGGMAGALAALQNSGLKSDQLGSFVTAFVEFAQEKAGGDLVNRLLDKIPEVKSLMA